MWAEMLTHWQYYDRYQELTEREIPVVVLERIGSGSARTGPPQPLDRERAARAAAPAAPARTAPGWNGAGSGSPSGRQGRRRGENWARSSMDPGSEGRRGYRSAA